MPADIEGNWDPSSEVVELCSDLIRIDTSNPGDGSGPGERAAAEYVAQKLAEVGIEPVIVESAAGRASVLARWGGTEGDPVLLHGHLDVVPAVAADWTHDPFAGDVIDGAVWGRGAVDMKDFDAMLLSTIRSRTRAGAVPKRPFVLAFTADEEAGGAMGAGWLIREHREWFEGCVAAVGEVGGFSVTVRDRRIYLIEAAEKGMAWLKLSANGHAGHGSMRHPDNAVTRLAGAVARVGEHEWPVTLTEPMRVLMAAVGELAGIDVTPDNYGALLDEFGPAARMLGAALRHSTNPTRLDAGYKVNVVPGHAEAWVDGRFLPGDEDGFFATIHELVGPGVDVDVDPLLPGVQTRYDGFVADAITASLGVADPKALVAPFLMSAGTDAKHWAELGMRAFGFAPLRLPADLDFTSLFHGIDERVPVESLEFGARVLDDFLGRL